MVPGVRAVTTYRCAHGYSRTRYAQLNLADHVGDAPATVAANRAWLATTLKLPNAPVWLRQVHGNHCLHLDGVTINPMPEADAAYTRTPGVVCAVLTADCLPIMLATSDATEVASIHAGWRGLAHGVIESTLARFRQPPSALIAWLGPAISAVAYQVGDDVRTAFVDVDARAATAFEPDGNGRWRCDLYALARQRLRRLGVASLAGGDRCTYSEPEHFYSYRRDGVTGRMASLIWIEPGSD